MKQKIERTNTSTKRFSVRTIAMVLSIVMLVGSIATGSMLSTFAAYLKDAAKSDALSQAATEGGDIAQNAIPGETVEDAVEANDAQPAPDLSDFEENAIVRRMKDDFAGTGANADLASTGWNWTGTMKLYDNLGGWDDGSVNMSSIAIDADANKYQYYLDYYLERTNSDLNVEFYINDGTNNVRPNNNNNSYYFWQDATTASRWTNAGGSGGNYGFNVKTVTPTNGWYRIRVMWEPYYDNGAGHTGIEAFAIDALDVGYNSPTATASTLQRVDITPDTLTGGVNRSVVYTVTKGADDVTADVLSGTTFKTTTPGTYVVTATLTDSTIAGLGSDTATKTITVTDNELHFASSKLKGDGTNTWSIDTSGTKTIMNYVDGKYVFYYTISDEEEFLIRSRDNTLLFKSTNGSTYWITDSYSYGTYLDTTHSGGNNFRWSRTGETVKITFNPVTEKIKIERTPPLSAPVIALSSYTANAGDTVTLNWGAVQYATSYDVYKGEDLVGTVAAGGDILTYTITTNASQADAGTYKVVAKTTDTSYIDSLPSNEVTLSLVSPQFYLVGDVGSDAFSTVNGTSTASNYDPDATAISSTPATYAQRWTTPYDVLKVDTVTAKAGKYSITVQTNDVDWINVGLYVSSGENTGNQYGFRVGDKYYNKPNADYTVPLSGITDGDECYAILGEGSLILPGNTTVTIYVDQTDNNKVTVETNRVQVKAIARVKNYVLDHNNTPTLGDATNATAAIATAKVTYGDNGNVKPATATLTATLVDDDAYTFMGWYTDSACTTAATFEGHDSATANLTGINDSVTYYALYQETKARDYTYTITAGTNGSFTELLENNCIGWHSGGQSGTVYRNGTLAFTVTPAAGYEVDTVTTTSGAVDYQTTDHTNGQTTVTISNITAAANINVTFKKASTYELTLVIGDDATYGNNFTVSYIDEDGVQQTSLAKESNDTINPIVGTDVTITANPASGGSFNGWRLVGSYQRSSTTPLSGDTITIRPGSDMTITALFTDEPQGETSQYYASFTSQFGNVYFTKYENATLTGIGSPFDTSTTIYKATITAPASSSYDFKLHRPSDSNEYTFEGTSGTNTLNMNQLYWVRGDDTNKKASGRISATNGTTYYLYLHDQNDSSMGFVISTTDLMSGGGTGDGDNDNIDKTKFTKLYVLDGVDTNGDFGTRTFGDTKVIKATQGLAKNNYYDQTELQNIVSDAYGDEGATLYYYDPQSNLDFRVKTTIAENHRAIGVRAYVMNGMTYPAKKDSDGSYYADITLDAEETAKGTNPETYDVLEIIPVYYNTLIPDRNYIKFYVDGNTINQSGWGKTIGYSLWYENSGDHGFEGGYPGQPLMSDGNLLYGYFPKYYVGNDATELPAAASYNRFNGVLLSNLAEHNSTHLAVLNEWGASLTSGNCNYQSFDYLDPVEISKIGDSDMIQFVAKYNNEMTNSFRKTYNSRTLYDLNGGDAWPTGSVEAPTSVEDALTKGFEYLLDIDGNRVNILNEHDVELTGKPIYVVSAGNQNSSTFPDLHSSNTWDTVWNLYDSNASGAATGDSLIAVRPVDFINPSADLSARLTAAFGENYQKRPVIIHYEKWLNANDVSDSNSGTRLDGRWLYTRSSDPTNVRLRVATADGSGNLTFSDQFINWAEISDGHVNGPKETNDALTKKLELDNRTTEVTAKINPVNYKVTGFYMLGAHYSSDTNNGFSSKLSDYNKLKANGTAYSYTNTQNNRMVIVIEQIPAVNLTLEHQMYGGNGAHRIDGIFKTKIELADKDGTVITLPDADTENEAIYGKFFTGLKELSAFTTDAPHYVNDQTTPVKKLKITLRTEMYDSTAFNQWYENGPSEALPYREIDSKDAKGSETPVEKVIYIDVNDLYTENIDQETGLPNGSYTLSTRSLNYYSDLISNATVDINHFLLGASEGMTANTYTHVTVVDSSGEPISGGDYAYRAQTTTVDTNHITKENADNGYQLYVEIWTEPTGFSGFDDFYLNSATKITTGPDGIIYYTNEETDTITVGGKTYQIATATIPISYFFKQTITDGQTVTIFDTAKKQFNLYSKLTDLRGVLDITHQLYRDTDSTGTAKTYITVDRLDNTDVLIKNEIPKTETLQANEYKVHLGKDVITPDTTDKLKITLTCELGNWTDFVQFDKMVNSLKSELMTSDLLEVTATVLINESGAVEKTATIQFRISNLFNQDKTQRVTQLDFLSEVEQPKFKYEITYKYNPYVASYGEQTYFKQGTFSQTELDDFMVYDNHSELKFKSDENASKKSFISSKAPMEDNFMTTLSYKNYQTAVVTYNNDDRDHTLIITVKPTSTESQIRVTLQLPYEIANATTYVPKVEANDRVNKTALTSYQRTTPMYGWLVTSGKQGPNNSEEGDPKFISAPLLLWNTSTNSFEHFVYWKVESLGTSVNSSKEYTRCYDYEFNFALFQDCIITPVYESGVFDATKMPSPPTTWDMYDRFDPYVMKNSDTSSFNGATITFIENSRNQYNHNGCGKLDPADGGVPLSRQGAADRIYTDFLLSFNNAIPGIDNLKTAEQGKYRCGVVVEAAGTLTPDSEHEGEYIVESEETYASNFADGVNKEKIKSFIKSGSGSGMMKSEFDATQLDDKNRLKYYVGFNNRTAQALGNEEHPAELPNTYTSTMSKVLRAYSYIYTVENDEITDIKVSDPTYFTIYGMASVKDGKAENV